MDRIPEWTLADRLRKARESAGFEQLELAGRLGAARTTISNYERGLTRPKSYLVKEWALATGVSRRWIETGQVTGELLTARLFALAA